MTEREWSDVMRAIGLGLVSLGTLLLLWVVTGAFSSGLIGGAVIFIVGGMFLWATREPGSPDLTS